MASAFGHAVAGYTLSRLSFPYEKAKLAWLAVFCAVIPDIDVVGRQFGVSRESMWGHRGITHSLLFAALLAVAIVLLFYRQTAGSQRLKLFFLLFVATASHGCLDALTDGGNGVGFFMPFSDARYFFPWHPIKVSPLGVSRFFSDRAWPILKSEAKWIGIPCAAMLWLNDMIRTFRTKG